MGVITAQIRGACYRLNTAVERSAVERATDRNAVVTRTRWNKDLFEISFLSQTGVCDTIQRHSTRETKTCQTSLSLKPARMFEQCFFSFPLQTRGEVGQ